MFRIQQMLLPDLGRAIDINHIATVLLAPEHSNGIRRMLIDNYPVFYVIKENRVIVTDVWYSASDINSRLKG